MFDVNKMMKQVKKMQEEVTRLREELAERTVEATAGGGVVRAVCNGNQDLVEIEIQKDAVDADDLEMLQDLIVAAVNEGMKKARDMVSEEMSRLTGGMKLPGMPGMPGMPSL